MQVIIGMIFLASFMVLLIRFPAGSRLPALAIAAVNWLSGVMVLVCVGTLPVSHETWMNMSFVIVVCSPFISCLDYRYKLSGQSNWIRMAKAGFVCGLLAPSMNLLLFWSPLLFRHIGIDENIASKLVLESFADHLMLCVYQLIPMSIFGFLYCLVLRHYSGLLIVIYKYIIWPFCAAFTKWLSGVFRY